MKEDTAGVLLAQAVLNRLAERSKVAGSQTDGCAFAAGVMNRIRLQSISLSHPDTTEALDDYMRRLADELAGPGFGADVFLQDLLNSLRPWLAPSGRIRVTSTNGYKTIMVDSQPAGYRNLDWRYPPGQHTVQVTEARRIIFSRTFTLSPGGFVDLDLDKEAPQGTTAKP
jgi:hypothetical protein